jgi:hypothetical protein
MACLSEVSAKMTNAVNEQIHVIASGARIEARPAYLFASSFLTKIIDGADVHSAFRFAEPPHNVSDFMYWPASMQTQDDRDAQIEYLKAELTKILVRLGDLEVAVRKMREGQTFTVDRSQAALVVIAMIMVGISFLLCKAADSSSDARVAMLYAICAGIFNAASIGDLPWQWAPGPALDYRHPHDDGHGDPHHRHLLLRSKGVIRRYDPVDSGACECAVWP